MRADKLCFKLLVLTLIMPSDLFSSHMLLLFGFEIFVLYLQLWVYRYIHVYICNKYICKKLKMYVRSWGKTLGHAVGSIPITLFPHLKYVK